jgi:hypothetical protein
VNWRRAKTLLLITFLVLDLMLAKMYLDVRTDGRLGHTARAALDPDIISQLEDNNLILATELPQDTPELALLRVGAVRQNPYTLAFTFFDTLEEVTMSRLEDPLLQAAFSRGQEEILFYSSGVTIYTCYRLDRSGGTQNSDQAQKRARQFLSDHGGLGELELVRSIPYRRQGTYLVEFTQKWQGRPLVGASGAVLIVTPGGVENCWRRYLTVLGESGSRRPVVPAQEALLTLALERPWPEATTLTIKEVTLGYYNKIYNADEWEAVPVWRIWAGGDTYFYVNAFTGELEAR